MRKRRALASKNDSEQPKKRRAGQICEMIAGAPGLWCRSCSCAQDGCIRARTKLTHLRRRHDMPKTRPSRQSAHTTESGGPAAYG